jgi:hypothetical protein
LFPLDEGVVIAVGGVSLGVVSPVVGAGVDMDSESLKNESSLSSLRLNDSGDIAIYAVVLSIVSELVEFVGIDPVESSLTCSKNREFLLVLVRALKKSRAPESVRALWVS